MSGSCDNAAAILRAEGVIRVCRSGAVEVQALRGVDLGLFEGEMVLLLRASGSGKSTLLNILGALDRPSAGRVLFRGQSSSGRSDAALTAFRRDHVGFAFQFYNLFPLADRARERRAGDRDRRAPDAPRKGARSGAGRRARWSPLRG